MRTRTRRARRPTSGERRVVVLGAGYVGLFAARRLQARLRPGEARVTVVDPRPYMTYQPLLPEAASGSLEPRHVAAPLRSLLDGCEVVTAAATDIDTGRRCVTVEAADGRAERLDYDVLVVAPGSVSKTLPVPGLAEEAVGFTTLGEAVYLRNHVLTQLDHAAATTDPYLRRRLLTFVFVGGGYAGVEALGELEDMARAAARRYYADRLAEDDMRWLLVEAADRIMPEVSESLAAYTVERLRERGMEVFLGTTVTSVADRHVVLGDGTEADAGTVVWTAGVAPHPLVTHGDLPLDEKGRVLVTPALSVRGRPEVYAAGDCAAVPDLSQPDPGATCPPTAQHALRQGRHLADNVLRRLRGRRQRDFEHAYAGSVATLGLHQGVAEIYGRRLHGRPAWLLHRAYHLAKMPTLDRRSRILADWALALPFGRQDVALGEVHRPRLEFAEEAAAAGE